jgi:iron(III) transport system substrate-binding protein
MMGTTRGKMMSVFLAVILIALAVLTGCGSKDDKPAQSNSASNGSTASQNADSKADSKSKKLVVYAALNEDDIVQIQK